MDPNKEVNVNNNAGDVSMNTLMSRLHSHSGYLKSKWKIFLIYLVAGITLGLVYSIMRKPRYTATITFTVEDNTGSSSISGLASQLGLNLGDKQGIFSGFNIISFFQSRLMVQKTLLSEARFGNDSDLLVNRYIKFNGYRNSWKKDPELKNITFIPNQPLSRIQDSLMREFYKAIITKQLDVERVDRRLTILSLTYTCTDELFAKNFSEILTKNVIDFYTKTRVEKIVKSINTFQRQSDSVRARLSRSFTNAAASVDAVPNANPLKKVLSVSAQNKSMDVEIDRSALMQLTENLQSAKISLNQETPLIDFIDTPILPLAVEKVTKIKGIAIGGFFGMVIGICVLTLRRKTYN
jgi:hypothetical protein